MRLRVASFVATAFAGAALAQQPPPVFAAPNLTPQGVASMASGCAMCHGPGGFPAPGSSVAQLAGRAANATADAMKAFRDGGREATVMRQIAKGFSDAEIEAMAAYFAAQKEAP